MLIDKLILLLMKFRKKFHKHKWVYTRSTCDRIVSTEIICLICGKKRKLNQLEIQTLNYDRQTNESSITNDR